jgi:hypothetical protein
MRRNPKNKSNLHASIIAKYGYWPHKTAYISNLNRTSKEFHRIIKETGKAHIKICEQPPHKSIRRGSIKIIYNRWHITNITERRSHSNMSKALTVWLSLTPHY